MNNNKRLLFGDHFQIVKAIHEDYPQIVKAARNCDDVNSFKEYLINLIDNDTNDGPIARDSKSALKALIEYDGNAIHELSTEETIHIETIHFLWSHLRGNPVNGITTDFLLDIYKLFKLSFQPIEASEATPENLLTLMKKWPSGLNKDVRGVRNLNKERIVNLLIKKVEKRNSTSKYHFTPNTSESQKREMILEWWESASFHITMAIKDPVELNIYLNNTLTSETMETLLNAKKKGIPFFITPYYISLLNTDTIGYDDSAIRSYVIYSRELIETYGSIKAWEKEDAIIPGKPNAAGWILPAGDNIHRRYPEVAILIPDSMGRACGGICASCQRMYGFQSARLNFDFESLKPKESWDNKLQRLMDFFENDPQLKDILITGGDAFMSMNATLKKILDAVYKMALRKKRANENRAEGEKYAQMKRVRLGSRLLAYLPQRVDSNLVEILREFREKGLKAGISQFIIQTHFQTPLEVTPEAVKAIKAITDAGWIITNQLVYTVASSRRGQNTKLRRILNSAGVMCYYTFTVKGFNENFAVYTPNSRSMQEQTEEKKFGYLNDSQQDELEEILYKHNTSLEKSGSLATKITDFLKKYNLPFLATDRNVLNLPAIGKSMTFKTVGLTKEGKRILKFDHDNGRNHSKIIDKLGEIYIIENKSIATYLRQIVQLGENPRDYMSIWSYTKGETESRFKFYNCK